MPRSSKERVLNIRIADRYAGFACIDASGVFDVADESHPTAVLKAKRLCYDCPVRSQCLNDALVEEFGVAVSGRWGVRGGTTPSERLQIEAERLHLKAARARANRRRPDNPAAAGRDQKRRAGDARLGTQTDSGDAA